MARPEERNLERVRYWQGQMLRSRDFLDIEAAQAQRRWWHNRALHNAYGVAEGLACSLVPSASPTAVSVSPGVAYDGFGRELILEKPLLVPLPSNVPANLTAVVNLVMRYKPVTGSLRPDESSEVCWTGGCLATGTAEFIWKLSTAVNVCEVVAVYAVAYQNGTLGDPLAFIPISVQPLSRPKLASGATIPGNTPWEPWVVGFSLDDFGNLVPLIIGVQTWIDTSAAGFTQVPCYFASLQGPLWNPQTQQLLPAIFPSIADEWVTGFYFRLWLTVVPPSQSGNFALRLHRRRAGLSAGMGFVTDTADFLTFAQQQELYVSWIGCQMLDGLSSCCLQPASTASSAPSQKL